MTNSRRACTLAACLLLSAALPLAAEDAPAKKRFSVDDFEKIVRLSSPRISPDGKSIAVVVTRADAAKNKWLPELSLVDAATGAMRALTHDRKGVSHPRWSPSGDRLAFLAADGAGKDAKPQIFVLPMAGGEARKVTSAPTGVQHFAWRPDGKAFAFAAEDERPNKAEIEKGNDLFEVGSDSLYVSEAAMPVHVWLVPADGGDAKRLTSGAWSLPAALPPSPPSSPLSWSPDGKSLAFVRVETPHSGDNDAATRADPRRRVRLDPRAHGQDALRGVPGLLARRLEALVLVPARSRPEQRERHPRDVGVGRRGSEPHEADRPLPLRVRVDGRWQGPDRRRKRRNARFALAGAAGRPGEAARARRRESRLVLLRRRVRRPERVARVRGQRGGPSRGAVVDGVRGVGAEAPHRPECRDRRPRPREGRDVHVEGAGRLRGGRRRRAAAGSRAGGEGPARPLHPRRPAGRVDARVLGPGAALRRAGLGRLHRRTTAGATTAGTPTSARSSTTRATAPGGTSSRAWTPS